MNKIIYFKQPLQKRLSPKFQPSVTWKLFKLERSKFGFLLKVYNHFVLPIANPFLSCPVAFYIIMWSNKRSLFNKRTNYFFFCRIQKTISVTPGSRRKPITLATAGAICLNWAVTCRIRDRASRHTSTPTTWFGSGAFEDEAEGEVEGMYSFAVGTINAYGN